MNVDCVIVGGGFAGLSAADSLVQQGKTFCLLEARDRVGGRVATLRLADGTPVDIGGQWLGSTQDRMYALCERFGAEVYPMYGDGKNVLVIGERRSLFRGNLPLAAGLGTVANLAWVFLRLHLLARRIPLESPWQTANAEKLDSETMSAWIGRNTPNKTARTFVELAVEAVFAADPNEMSLLHALYYMRSGNSFDFLTKNEGGAQQDRVSGGVQALAEQLAKAVQQRGEVVLEAPVTAINQHGDGVTVTSSQGPITARYTIVALPPPLAATVEYTPALSAAKRSLLEGLPMGSVIKCLTIYDEPFWRDLGLSGHGMVCDGPVNVAFDASPKSGMPGVLCGFMEGSAAREMAQATTTERRGLVLEAFSRLLGERARSPREYLDRAWSTEEWSGGCYAALFGPGVWTSVGHTIRAPEGRIHFAGTETAQRWNGYMEGAVLSGERAAQEVLRELA